LEIFFSDRLIILTLISVITKPQHIIITRDKQHVTISYKTIVIKIHVRMDNNFMAYNLELK